MNTARTASLLCALIALASVKPGFADTSWTWTKLAYSDGSGIAAYGISGNGIVGCYGASGQTHGFLYDGSAWTTLDYPGAGYTEPHALSDGSIVGTYYPTANAAYNRQGFLYKDGTWTSLSYPGAVLTDVHGISGNALVGEYQDSTGHYFGFRYQDGNWTTLAFPGSCYTAAYGIFDNKIVGSYSATGYTDSGFVYDGTNWTTLSHGAWTDILGISGSNMIAQGHLNFRDPYPYASLTDGTTWTTLTAPWGVTTHLNGISGNRIVGQYSNANGAGGSFLLTIPEPASLTLLALGGLLIARRRCPV